MNNCVVKEPLKTKRLYRLISKAIKDFKLNLEGKNVLVLSQSKQGCLTALLAAMSGAKTVYVSIKDKALIKRTGELQVELGIANEIRFIINETPDILKNIDIVLKNDPKYEIDVNFVQHLRSDCSITLLPENMDFSDITGIDLEAVSKRQVPIVSVDPADKVLGLYKYFSHIVLSRCYQVGLEVFRSKVMLIGHGELLHNTLSLFKSIGTDVYSLDMNISEENEYILKHLTNMDAVIILDYPQRFNSIVGNSGLITMEDISSMNPDLKVVHISGIVDEQELIMAKIDYQPSKIYSKMLSLSTNDIGLKLTVESIAASLKCGDHVIKVNKNTTQQNDSVVTYHLVNHNRLKSDKKIFSLF